MNKARLRKGSLNLEYALLISVAVAALIAMSVYLMRSISGRMREVGDTFGFGRQFEPGLTVETRNILK